MSTPTQVAHPWITTARTVLQVIVSVVLWLVAAVLTLAAVAPQILEAVAEVLPPEWLAWLSGAVAFLGLLAGAITRIMAIPQVNDLLGRLKAPTHE